MQTKNHRNKVVHFLTGQIIVTNNHFSKQSSVSIHTLLCPQSHKKTKGFVAVSTTSLIQEILSRRSELARSDSAEILRTKEPL